MSDEVPAPTVPDAPDVEFRVAFGVYVGSVAAGTAATLAPRFGAADAAGRYLLALSAFGAAAVAGALVVGRIRGFPERAGAGYRRFGFAVAPPVLFAPVFVSRVAVGAALLGAAGSVLAGLLLAVMTRTRYVAAICADREPLAVWRATTPPRRRRRRLLLAGVGFAVGLALVVAGTVADATPLGAAGNLLVGATAATAGAAVRDDTFRAYPFGLSIEPPVARRFLPWRRVTGYELTADELRLRRRWLPDYRCHREAIDDVEAVLAALDRVYDRSDRSAPPVTSPS